MITLLLNDKKTEIAKNTTLTSALEKWQHQGQYFSVAINGEFIPRSQHDETILQDEDKIEIVTPMQGG